jgi:isochorismate synthase EntC
MFVFTGSGIISKSDAKKEWEETKIKSKHILDYFK